MIEVKHIMYAPRDGTIIRTPNIYGWCAVKWVAETQLWYRVDTASISTIRWCHCSYFTEYFVSIYALSNADRAILRDFKASHKHCIIRYERSMRDELP